jgi:hypothetical protein
MMYMLNAHILALASHMSSRDPQATVLGRALTNPERNLPKTTPAILLGAATTMLEIEYSAQPVMYEGRRPKASVKGGRTRLPRA